jgi:hypothetical protein
MSKSLFAYVLFFLTFGIFTIFGSLAISKTESVLVVSGDQPLSFWQTEFFWKNKPELIKKIKEERKIISSATKPKDFWWFKGVGDVNAPADFAFSVAQKYERLNEMKEIFQKVEFNKSTQILRLEQKFMGRIMISKFFIEPVVDKNQRYLFFRMMNGPFKNSTGIIEFSDVSSQVSQISAVSRVLGELKWVPDTLFGLAVEGVMHIVASSMRSIIEKEWAQNSQREKAK